MKIKRVHITLDNISDISDIIKRDTGNFSSYEDTVKDILDDIKLNGDKALFSYMEKFDKVNLSNETIEVSKEEIEAAVLKVDKDLLDTIKKSAENIRAFHEKIDISGFKYSPEAGIVLGQKVTPLERVGVYVPGGKAAYPSTVLMDAIPASVAGVNEIIMVTPPDKDGNINPVILAAAKYAKVDRVLKIGGAQAIAALAYGTESVPKVDKIVGPGNIYVALAKRFVFGSVGLDSVAGPSEITVLCDGNANPKFVAADMLSQAEHDEMAQSILVTTSEHLANEVETHILDFLSTLDRAEIMKKSLSDHGVIFICDNIDTAIEAVNTIAPEHLEVQTKENEYAFDNIKNAGAIFLGEYTSEPLGDYFAGPNHVLPTNGTARFFSPLNTADFVKKSSIISYSKDAFVKACDHVIRFAQSEGLDAHANSIIVRKESL